MSASKHPQVQTYKYSAGDEVRYRRAILLQRVPVDALPPLSPEEEAVASEERQLWHEELERASEPQGKLDQPWWHVVEERFGSPLGFDSHPWTQLVQPTALGLERTRVDLTGKAPTDGFEVSADREWLLGGELLSAVVTRVPDPEDRRSAARLFFLHEGLHHFGPQKVAGALADRVGRFPRVLEELDYQADVWAMVHELCRAMEEDPDLDVQAHLRRLVELATEVFWAFDDRMGALRRIQVRRLNRYLIWYWQMCRIEDAANGAEAVRVLSSKPVLELAGLEVTSVGHRVFCSLDAASADMLEFAVIEDGALRRRPDGIAFRLKDLVASISVRQGDGILQALRAIRLDVRA